MKLSTKALHSALEYHMHWTRRDKDKSIIESSMIDVDARRASSGSKQPDYAHNHRTMKVEAMVREPAVRGPRAMAFTTSSVSHTETSHVL
jgi:hypothetical protein